jgi:chloride channel 3/4/5
VAFIVDIVAATLADYKMGYCSSDLHRNRESCCTKKTPVLGTLEDIGECAEWKTWSNSYWASYGIYIAFAVLFGIVAGAITMTTKANLPAAEIDKSSDQSEGDEVKLVGKSMYMAAGSGIPEIKTILSGFVIPHFLDFKVLFVKAVGSTFAVATGMCLGKEGPFVHISTCVGYLVASLFPKYRENGRKMREMLSVACSAGLSVAFGAPIGGVLFSYEVRDLLFGTETMDSHFPGNQHIFST